VVKRIILASRADVQWHNALLCLHGVTVELMRLTFVTYHCESAQVHLNVFKPLPGIWHLDICV